MSDVNNFRSIIFTWAPFWEVWRVRQAYLGVVGVTLGHHPPPSTTFHHLSKIKEEERKRIINDKRRKRMEWRKGRVQLKCWTVHPHPATIDNRCVIFHTPTGKTSKRRRKIPKFLKQITIESKKKRKRKRNKPPTIMLQCCQFSPFSLKWILWFAFLKRFVFLRRFHLPSLDGCRSVTGSKGTEAVNEIELVTCSLDVTAADHPPNNQWRN